MRVLIAFVLFFSCFATVSAQQLREPVDDGRENLNDPIESGLVTTTYRFSEFEGLSGGQFRLKYDPAKLQVVDLSNCLAGVPESHRGEFSTCRNIADRGIVQFLIMDLGGNSPIGTDPLGSVTFRKVGSVKDVDEEITIEDLRLAGPDGRHLQGSFAKKEALVLDSLMQ